MKIKSFCKKFWNPVVWGNIGAMIVVTFLIIYGTLKWLDHYTNHGQKISVPDITNMSSDLALQNLKVRNLKGVIIDTSYVRNKRQGVILEQSIHPGKAVKEGRTIYLTINSKKSPTIAIPDLADNCSVREAETRLRAIGFKLTENEYIEGEKGWVYGIKAKGKNLLPGTRISKEIPLTIVVGKGEENFSEEEDSVKSQDDTYQSLDEIGDKTSE